MYSNDQYQQRLNKLKEEKKYQKKTPEPGRPGRKKIVYQTNPNMKTLTIHISVRLISLIEELIGRKFGDIVLVLSKSEFFRRAAISELERLFTFINDFEKIEEIIKGVEK